MGCVLAFFVPLLVMCAAPAVVYLRNRRRAGPSFSSVYRPLWIFYGLLLFALAFSVSGGALLSVSGVSGGILLAAGGSGVVGLAFAGLGDRVESAPGGATIPASGAA